MAVQCASPSLWYLPGDLIPSAPYFKMLQSGNDGIGHTQCAVDVAVFAPHLLFNFVSDRSRFVEDRQKDARICLDELGFRFITVRWDVLGMARLMGFHGSEGETISRWVQELQVGQLPIPEPRYVNPDDTFSFSSFLIEIRIIFLPVGDDVFDEDVHAEMHDEENDVRGAHQIPVQSDCDRRMLHDALQKILRLR